MPNVNLLGQYLSIEYKETHNHMHCAKCTYDSREFIGPPRANQNAALRSLGSILKKYDADKVAMQAEQKKLDAWNRGESKQF